MNSELKNMIRLPYDEFLSWVNKMAEGRSPELRKGQFIYSMMVKEYYDAVLMLEQCGVDCFNDDSVIDTFLSNLHHIASRINVISDMIMRTLDEHGINAQIAKVFPTYQLYTVELQLKRKVSKKTMKKAVESLNWGKNKWQKPIRLSYKGDAPLIEVGDNPLPTMLPDLRIVINQNGPSQVPVVLGMDTSNGSLLDINLAHAGNILIGGATKQGKTTCLKNIITWLENIPSHPEIILCDPKQCEFDEYKGKHSICTEAASLGRNVVATVLARVYATDQKTFPPLVYIIDEYADLLMSRELPLQEMLRISRIRQIAEYGPQVNVHLIMTTNRIEKKNLPPEIASHIKTRIAFRTISESDSKLIIAQTGAEQLLGQGDALYCADGECRRFQTAPILPLVIP